VNKNNPILLTALAHQEAYDAGIVPPDKDFSHDMNNILSQLTPEESRRVRRKFRKLWRKLARYNPILTADELIRSSDTSRRTGLGIKEPTRWHRAARKAVVHWELYKRARQKLSD